MCVRLQSWVLVQMCETLDWVVFTRGDDYVIEISMEKVTAPGTVAFHLSLLRVTPFLCATAVV